LEEASLVPRKRDPRAIAFNRRGGEHSRNTNVGSWTTGNMGTNLEKNMCKQLSRNFDVRSLRVAGVVMPVKVLLSCALSD
jgi:hypothetical protein